ncbi:NotI family restriction endonuclease [Humibacillus xanthopallidus]|uniref:NotI family restriction endonuclease n=1 Tax=Humibacillus xanthopallidus TaxID=412689 RepID=UPI001FE90AE4|nr:NotI family restriction endonuclease [Humibacillus xanthopallidus]
MYEFFGFRASDNSAVAVDHAQRGQCPFLQDRCEKTLSDGLIAGVCTLKPVTSTPVICCPVRLYADDYRVLRDVADMAFTPGLALHPGGAAASEARHTGHEVIAVFGKRWGGELRLPQRQGRGSYFVDWILARLDAQGNLAEFVAIEVQSIDTTGNYRNGRTALLAQTRHIERTTAGFNWENVSKRILPQVIYKGNVLQRESLCQKGLFFVVPSPVYGRIMDRLGGSGGLLPYPLQSSSITFMSYDLDLSAGTAPGLSVPLKQEHVYTTNIGQVAQAFAGPGVMPPQDCYRDAIRAAL